MQTRRIVIGLAPVDRGDFRAYYHKITLTPEMSVRETARRLSLSTFGCLPFVFASYPPDTGIREAEGKLRALWRIYQAKEGASAT